MKRKLFILLTVAALMLCACGTDAADAAEPSDQETDLEADGSYRFTVPGAYTHYGYGKKQFEDGEWTYTFVAECFTTFETEYSLDKGTLVYLIDGNQVDAAAFAAYEAQHDAKPDPVRYDSWEALLAAQE